MAELSTNPSTSASADLRRELEKAHQIAQNAHRDITGEFRRIDPAFTKRFDTYYKKTWLPYVLKTQELVKYGKRPPSKEIWTDAVYRFDLSQRELAVYLAAWNKRVEAEKARVKDQIQKEKLDKAKQKPPKVKPVPKGQQFIGPPLPPGFGRGLTRDQWIALGVGGVAAVVVLVALGSRK